MILLRGWHDITPCVTFFYIVGYMYIIHRGLHDNIACVPRIYIVGNLTYSLGDISTEPYVLSVGIFSINIDIICTYGKSSFFT